MQLPTCSRAACGVLTSLVLSLGCSTSAGSDDPRDLGSVVRDLGGTPREDAQVFFSGHSLINLNTPRLFEQFAGAAGLDVGYQSHIGNGSTMGIRLECTGGGQQADGSPVSFLTEDELRRASHYDTLVVTERHDIIMSIAGERATSMAKIFYDRFLEGNASGRPFLYESWFNIDTGSPQGFRDRVARERVAWDCLAARVNAARSNGQPEMRVLPAATALNALVGEVLAGNVPGMDSLTDVFDDNVHLTPEGNYFIGLFLYAVLLERSPIGLPHEALTVISGASPVLTAETATRLQEIAQTQASLAIAEDSAHLRSQSECLGLLTTVCGQTPGASAWLCDTALPQGYGSVSDPVPEISDAWCVH